VSVDAHAKGDRATTTHPGSPGKRSERAAALPRLSAGMRDNHRRRAAARQLRWAEPIHPGTADERRVKTIPAASAVRSADGTRAAGLGVPVLLRSRF